MVKIPQRSTLNVRIAQFHAFSVYRVYSAPNDGKVLRVMWHLQDDRDNNSRILYKTQKEALMQAYHRDKCAIEDYTQRANLAQQIIGSGKAHKKQLTRARKDLRESKAYLSLPVSGKAVDF